MSGLNYCFTDLPDHVRTQCAAWLRGGIDSVAIIESDANITNYASASAWQTAIDAEKVKIIHDIKGEFPDGSAVTGENPIGCGNDTILDGYDFVLNVMDFNVSDDNDTFYSTINGRQFYIAFRLCNEGQILVVELPVTVQASPANVPMSNKEKQRYNVVLAWSADANWKFDRYTAPASIFD